MDEAEEKNNNKEEKDVLYFLDNIEKQFDFYKRRSIDMFKGGISVPGMTLLYFSIDRPYDALHTLKREDKRHHAKEVNVRGLPSSVIGIT